MSEALAEALGQPCVLGGWRDRGVQAVVALFASGLTQEQAVAAARAAKTDPWWQGGKRGLSSLTLEVARRALGSPPGTSSDPARAAAEAYVRGRAKQMGETLPPDEFERRVLHELDPQTHRDRAARDRMAAEDRERESVATPPIGPEQRREMKAAIDAIGGAS